MKNLTGMVNCWLRDEASRIINKPLFASVFFGVHDSGKVQGIDFENKSNDDVRKVVTKSITKHQNGDKRFEDVDVKTNVEFYNVGVSPEGRSLRVVQISVYISVPTDSIRGTSDGSNQYWKYNDKIFFNDSASLQEKFSNLIHGTPSKDVRDRFYWVLIGFILGMFLPLFTLHHTELMCPK